MLTWFASHLIDLVLLLVVVLVVFLIVRGMIRDKKAGKASCGCDCSSCGCGCSGYNPHATCSADAAK